MNMLNCEPCGLIAKGRNRKNFVYHLLEGFMGGTVVIGNNDGPVKAHLSKRGSCLSTERGYYWVSRYVEFMAFSVIW